jgi:Fic/DOC family protein
VIESRQEKNPGEFKTENNRAGNTVFGTPDLVIGTLEKGYEIIMSAATPGNRAALAMFVVAEVHPFTDGNGRTARLAMNHFLTGAGLTRIIIPTGYREDYISALKAMSSNSLSTPLVRMLTRAARFSRWVSMSSKAGAFTDLKRSNAFGRPETQRLDVRRLSCSDAGWRVATPASQWAREWDSNPRTPVKMLLEFQGSPAIFLGIKSLKTMTYLIINGTAASSLQHCGAGELALTCIGSSAPLR